MSADRDLIQRLSYLLEARNSFAIVDNLNKPTYSDYIYAKMRIRRQIKQTIKDIRHWRWFVGAKT